MTTPLRIHELRLAGLTEPGTIFWPKASHAARSRVEQLMRRRAFKARPRRHGLPRDNGDPRVGGDGLDYDLSPWFRHLLRGHPESGHQSNGNGGSGRPRKLPRQEHLEGRDSRGARSGAAGRAVGPERPGAGRCNPLARARAGAARPRRHPACFSARNDTPSAALEVSRAGDPDSGGFGQH